MRKAFYIALVAIALYKLKMNVEPRQAVVEDEAPTQVTKKIKNKREPASLRAAKQTMFKQQPYQGPVAYEDYRPSPAEEVPPAVDETQGQIENEPATANAPAVADEPSAFSIAADGGATGGEPISSEGLSGLDDDGSTAGLTSGSKGGSTSGGVAFGGGGFLPSPTSGGSNGSTTGSTGGTTSGASDGLSCTADTASGSFFEPISVQLSCDVAGSTIQYCISDSGCCDPSTSGTLYTGVPISIGTEAKTYCLSILGTSGVLASEVEAYNYVFNPHMPDLAVQLAKIQYQTTELPTIPMEVESDDFGSDTYHMGLINFKSHDPVALSMDCTEQLQDFGTLTAPVPLEVQAPVSLSTFNAGDVWQQVFNATNLVYGGNHITHYVANDFWPEFNKCETATLTLYDFPYFQAEVAHGAPGTNTVREFSGGFSSYGFFEAAADINRLPAGSSTDDQTTQELEAGLFSVFY